MFKGAICESWLPVKSILTTNGGQRIEVTPNPARPAVAAISW